ncbi:MAG: phycobilisome protein, partial [Pleurocapsa sp.]
EITAFQLHIAKLAKRLEVYEYLRDREIDIFQPIADELSEAYSQVSPQLIEKALKLWLSIMRYCAMAMLLNNPEYLKEGVLDWLTDTVKAHQMQSIEIAIYDLLSSKLKKSLPEDQFALMQPFLEQTQEILGEKVTTTIGA